MVHSRLIRRSMFRFAEEIVDLLYCLGSVLDRSLYSLCLTLKLTDPFSQYVNPFRNLNHSSHACKRLFLGENLLLQSLLVTRNLVEDRLVEPEEIGQEILEPFYRETVLLVLIRYLFCTLNQLLS